MISSRRILWVGVAAGLIPLAFLAANRDHGSGFDETIVLGFLLQLIPFGLLAGAKRVTKLSDVGTLVGLIVIVLLTINAWAIYFRAETSTSGLALVAMPLYLALFVGFLVPADAIIRLLRRWTGALRR